LDAQFISTHPNLFKMNRHANATTITQQREAALMRHLNGDLITEEDLQLFPCSEESFASLIPALRSAEPSFQEATKAGGLGNHKDLQLLCGGTMKGLELKVSEAKVPKDILEWQPWEGGVQFLQGQIKSKLMASFLGPCGPPMVAGWFEKVKTLMANNLPTFAVPTLEDYTKVVFSLSGGGDTAAGKLIGELRRNNSVRQTFQDAWLLFEDEWFATHTPDHNAFQGVLKQVLEEKDYWININKSGAFLIEGFYMIGLDYVGTAKKPKGGTVFRYKIKLQKKQRGDIQEVPIVLKFYWKNGGQAVQNINLLVVSDPLA
jgi:hypothetical protein